MPGRKPRTSRVLILISVILCLIFGATLTQSSASPSPIAEGKMPDMFVANDVDDSVFTSQGTVAVDNDFSDSSKAEAEAPDPTEEPSATETPTPAQEPAEEEIFADASPEAAKGVWTANGSNWMFLVDGNAFTGWLSDTDGKRYFFDNNGIMQTGWLDEGGKRYYLNLDGIMQTGDVTIGKETYHFLDDGSLEGFVPEATPTPKPKKKKETAKDTKDTKNSSDKKNDSKKDKKDADKSKDKKRKTIALTFDDGPSSFTDRLLDCLEENNAKATFFMVGQEIANFPETVKRMDALGHELGNHTYSHLDLTSLSAEDISQQIGGTDQSLLELVGHGASVLRPPYGSINDAVVAEVGTPMIIWSVDTLDWDTLDVDQTVETVMDNAQDGAIILMHDIYETSVEAAEIIIPRLIEEGYDLVTVHELAEAHGVDLKPGIAYGALN
ncbi:polysaccharide deacetylase family protein [Blautia schinkii]|nr:polysaccharide deacetylase family protein [Blautia schinkii]